MDDDGMEGANVGAVAAAQLAQTKVIVDTAIASWASTESKVRIRAGAVEYVGRLMGFDGSRLFLVDYMDNPTVIYLNSGVAITGRKE